MARQRIQLFLDDDQYDAVAQLATAQDRPIPDLVHDLVDLGLERLKRRVPERKRALQELTALRQSIEAQSGTYPGDPIADARAVREKQMDTAFAGADEP